MTSQRKAEYRAVACLFLMMTVAAIAFLNTSESSRTALILHRFSDDWTAFLGVQVRITVAWFGVCCLGGALFSLALLLPWFQRRSTYWQQRLYSFGALPLLAFTVMVGWYIGQTRTGNWIEPAVYLLFFGLFAVLGANTYRD